jgi:peptidoglycan/xylan/chitin deacetylase (PgdA/CDA1 family)
VPDNAVLLTFDDGYESFYTYGYPILRTYDYPATNFVIVSSIDDRNRKGIPKLTWEQMREMKKDGMSFYSHTYDSHLYGPIDVDGNEGAVLSNQLYLENRGRMESITEYVRRISDDLALAERRLKEELSNRRGIVAFPYGQYNQEELNKVLKTLGIEFTFTVQPGINSRSDRLGRRIDASSADQTPEKLIAQLKALKDVP